MAVKKWLGGANGSANDLAVASNYVPSGVPANGDDLYIEGNPSGTNQNITTNLTTFQNTTLNSINISQDYTGTIGVANTGTSSTTTGYMSLGGTNNSAITVNIGYQAGGTNAGNGSNLIRLNTGSMLGTFNITNSGAQSVLANAGPITLLGTHTANIMNLQSGIVSVAVDPTEVSTFLTVNNKGNLFFGTGATLTTINMNGGSLAVKSAVPTLNQTLGSTTINGTGTVGTANLYGGAAVINTTGTVSALNIYGASADFSRNQAARTVTTITCYSGYNLNLNNGVKNSITVTNPIVTNGPGTLSAWFGSKYALS